MTALELDAQQMIEAAGARYHGAQRRADGQQFAVFTEPESRSTAMLPLEGLTFEAVTAKLREIRARFGLGAALLALTLTLALLPVVADAQSRVIHESHSRTHAAPYATGWYTGYEAWISGETEAPWTFRGLVADVTLSVADWPNAPQLIDGANISSITYLHTIPRLWQGVEIGIFQEPDTPTCTFDDGGRVGCGGTSGTRGMTITMGNHRPPGETPRDERAWTGLELIALPAHTGSRPGRMLGTAVSIDGNWAQPVWIMNSQGQTIFRIDDDGTVSIRNRRGRLMPINP